MRLVVDLTLPTDARLISLTRRVVSGYLAELGVEGEAADDVVLALGEACTNVMLHAFPLDRDDCFHLTAEIDDHSVTLIVEDTGVGLPASRVAREPDIDLTATSGRGLHIIRELMTDVAVETGPSRRGTRLEMRKSLL